MAKLWHPTIKDLSIERDEAEVAAYVAAGWLKNKSTRKSRKTEKPAETATNESAKTDEPERAETTSTGDGEAN